MEVSLQQHDDLPGGGETALYDEGVEMAKDFERNLRSDFGIEVKVEHRTDPDRADGQIRVHIQDIPAEEARSLEQAARERALQNLTTRFGGDTRSIAEGMRAWEETRSRLVRDLGTGRDVEIELTTYDDQRSDNLRSSAQALGDSTIAANPLHYTGLRGTGGGERTRGFTADYIHERTHQLGCTVGSRSACEHAGKLYFQQDAMEAATVADVDRTLGAIGAPMRLDYHRGGFSGPGSTANLEGGATATVPSSERLRGLTGDLVRPTRP